MDATNYRILEALQKDARIPFTRLGKELGMSSPAIGERVKKMEDMGVIQGYKAIVDSKSLGYQLQAMITLRAFVGKLRPLLDKVPQLREVRNCYRITGTENIIMEVVLEDQGHLERFIDLLIAYGETRTHIVLSQVIAQNPIQRPLSRKD